MLRVAFFAIDWSVLCRLEWHFAFLLAIGTNCLMHFSRLIGEPKSSTAVSTAKSSHVISSWLYVFS